VVRCWWQGWRRDPVATDRIRRDAVWRPCWARRKAPVLLLRLGEDDLLGILDLPDNMWMAAVNMTIGATGLVNTKTIVLLTPEEVDEDARKSVAYRAPGRLEAQRRANPLSRPCATEAAVSRTGFTERSPVAAVPTTPRRVEALLRTIGRPTSPTVGTELADSPSRPKARFYVKPRSLFATIWVCSGMSVGG
jgi:hypothetical protein